MRKKLIALKKPMIFFDVLECKDGCEIFEDKKNDKLTYSIELRYSSSVLSNELRVDRATMGKICKEVININRGGKKFGKYVKPIGYYSDQKLFGVVYHIMHNESDESISAAKITSLIEKLKKEERDKGFNLAVAIAEDYDSLSSHPNRVSDCIRAKANRLPKSKIRKNAK